VVIQGDAIAAGGTKVKFNGKRDTIVDMTLNDLSRKVIQFGTNRFLIYNFL